MILMAPTRNDDSMMTPAQHPMHAVIAPLGPAPQPLIASDMMGMNPNVPAPMADSSPVVTRAMSPREQYEAKEGQRLMGDISKDQNPYGSASNHPGFLGKFLHGLNVATGGVNRRQFEEQNLGKELESIENENSRRGLEQAQTAETSERTREMPAELTAKEEKSQAKPVFKEYSGPDGARQWFQIGQQPEGWQAYEKPTAQSNNAFAQWSANPQKYEDFVKTMDGIKAEVAAEHPEQAKNAGFMNIYAAQRFLQMAYTHNPALVPVASQMIGKLLNLTPQQMRVFSEVPEDQPLSPETGNPIGTAMPEAPTGGTRSQAQTAARVLIEIPSIRQSIENLGDDLGPVAGRWNEFVTGKIGAGDPRYEALRTNLQFLNSAAAKFHLNSVRAVQEFNRLASAGKMTPQVLNGYIDAVENWANMAQAQERGYGETQPHASAQEPSRPANVPEGYKYDANGPKGAGWYKPKAVE